MRKFDDPPRIGVLICTETETPKERLERKERQRREGVAKYHKAIDAVRKAREIQDVDLHGFW